MASITTATQVAPSNITETEQPNTAIGSNRGRGRGGSRSTHNDDNSRGGRGAGHRRGRGGRGSRADGRGNTNQRGRRQSNLAVQPAPPLPPPPGLGGGGSFSGRLTKDAETVEGEGEGKVEGKRHEIQEEDDVEAEVCFICASPVVHNSVAPCNHRTCHICALRLRALYKTRACAHCRVRSISQPLRQ